MRELPLIPTGCSLSDEELAGHRARAVRLRPAVASIRRGLDRLEVHFTAAVDTPVLQELIAVERECCPFFRLDFDPATLVLRAEIDDPARRGALASLGEFFGPS